MQFGNSYTRVYPGSVLEAICEWNAKAYEYNKLQDEQAIAAFRNNTKGFLWWKRKVTETEARKLAAENWAWGIGYDRCYEMRQEIRKLSNLAEAALNACSDALYLSSDHAAILYRNWE